MNKVYYVYRHVRLDTNEVFYVGKGTRSGRGTVPAKIYYRAYDKWKRGSYWLRIAGKTNYLVEILFESTDEKLVFKKEKEFIKLYGRKDLNHGTLINFTDGGEGMSNHKMAPEVKEKMFANNLYFGKFGADHFGSKKVFAYKLTGEFVGEFCSYKDAGEQLGICSVSIGNIIHGKQRQAGGFYFFLEYKGEKTLINIPPQKNRTKIIVKNVEMNTSEVFESLLAAERATGIQEGTIRYRCNHPTANLNHNLQFSFH